MVTISANINNNFLEEFSKQKIAAEQLMDAFEKKKVKKSKKKLSSKNLHKLDQPQKRNIFDKQQL